MIGVLKSNVVCGCVVIVCQVVCGYDLIVYLRGTYLECLDGVQKCVVVVWMVERELIGVLKSDVACGCVVIVCRVVCGYDLIVYVKGTYFECLDGIQICVVVVWIVQRVLAYQCCGCDVVDVVSMCVECDCTVVVDVGVSV